jgi:hypothetical protein
MEIPGQPRQLDRTQFDAVDLPLGQRLETPPLCALRRWV